MQELLSLWSWGASPTKSAMFTKLRAPELILWGFYGGFLRQAWSVTNPIFSPFLLSRKGGESRGNG